VLVWDRALSDEELLDASEYLRREVLGVAPAPAPPFADRARLVRQRRFADVPHGGDVR
jgi:hypothetical protein